MGSRSLLLLVVVDVDAVNDDRRRGCSLHFWPGCRSALSRSSHGHGACAAPPSSLDIQDASAGDVPMNTPAP
eukprot:scaffold161020_cov31-Tisochrysis_lutea.AAC.6